MDKNGWVEKTSHTTSGQLEKDMSDCHSKYRALDRHPTKDGNEDAQQPSTKEVLIKGDTPYSWQRPDPTSGATQTLIQCHKLVMLTNLKGICPRKVDENWHHMKTCTEMCIAASFTVVKTSEQPRWLSAEWMAHGTSHGCSVWEKEESCCQKAQRKKVHLKGYYGCISLVLRLGKEQDIEKSRVSPE